MALVFYQPIISRISLKDEPAALVIVAVILLALIEQVTGDVSPENFEYVKVPFDTSKLPAMFPAPLIFPKIRPVK